MPTIGGRLCCGAALPPGPFDQRPNESRSDVLVYSTPPLEQDVEVTGFITAELYASTSAADTDFTAMIVDVEPSGYARYLGDGIIRARYRNSTATAEAIEPGKGLQILDRPLGDEQCLQSRSSHSYLRFEQQFPAVQSKSEHWREDNWRNTNGESQTDHLSRCRTSLSNNSSDHSERISMNVGM